MSENYNTLKSCGEYDVLVIGASFGGVCAAIGAARCGSRVALIEKGSTIGGQAAEIHTWGLDGFVSPAGNQVIKGLPEEILERTVKLGGSDPLFSLMPPEVAASEGLVGGLMRLGRSSVLSHATREDIFNPFNDTYVDKNAYCYTVNKMLFDEGVDVYLDSPVIDVIKDGERITGVVALGNFGKYSIGAKRTVDTTPTSVTLSCLGIERPDKRGYMGAHIRITGVNIEKFFEYVEVSGDDWYVRPMYERKTNAEELRRMASEGCTLFMKGFKKLLEKAVSEDGDFALLDSDASILYEHNGNASPFIPGGHDIDFSNPLEYSRAIATNRRKHYLTYRFFKEYVPGFEDIRLCDICATVPKAMRLDIAPTGLTEYAISEDEITSGVSASNRNVAHIKGHPGRSQNPNGWYVPLDALIPKGTDGLLITGKSAHPFIHYIASCAALGQSAGVSAAISAKVSVPLRELDTELVRRELSTERQNKAWRITKS